MKVRHYQSVIYIYPNIAKHKDIIYNKRPIGPVPLTCADVQDLTSRWFVFIKFDQKRTYKPTIMILGLSVFQKKSFKGFNTFDLSDLEYGSRSFLFFQTLLGTIRGPYYSNIMIVDLLVFQKKLFKGINKFDLCDFEYGSRSYFFLKLCLAPSEEHTSQIQRF